MASSANSFLSTAAKLNREDLSGIIDLTQRSDTPIYSMIGKDKAESTFTEWGIEALDAPGQNIQSESRDYAFATPTANVRMGNYTQILEKNGKFSKTQEAIANAGEAEKIARNKLNKGLALKTDVEYSLVAANPSVAGADRQSGSLSTWATTNVSRGATGANGGYNTGTKLTVAATPGTQRAFTKTLLDDLLQSSFSSGAKLKDMFFSPYAKRVFAGFMSDANVAAFRREASTTSNTLVADAEVYLGPLGTVTAHPDFVMGASATLARNVFVLDTTKIKWSWLRKIAEDKDLAKIGDYDRFVLQGEGCVKVLNEKAVGVIADVFGLTVSS